MAKNKINELRAQRAKTWDSAKAFLDSHRNEKGILSAADTATYEQMEQEIVDLGHEIERQERLDAMEREMALPVNTPITGKPQNPHAEEKTGRASDEYKKNFWNAMRSKNPDRAIVNALQKSLRGLPGLGTLRTQLVNLVLRHNAIPWPRSTISCSICS